MADPLIVCICDYWRRRHYQNRPLPAPGDSCPETQKPLRRLTIQVDAINGNYLMRELLQQHVLGDHLRRQHGVQVIRIEFVPPATDVIDHKFADMLAHTIWEHIEVENLMSWLSTLGGGFSALGEQFSKCAETAGKISLQQLKIGLRLGDPFLQARCKLYFSISLIQRGMLRTAKHIIREQYAFASKHAEKDARLVRMCLGIWLRLRYEYEQRSLRKRGQ